MPGKKVRDTHATEPPPPQRDWWCRLIRNLTVDVLVLIAAIPLLMYALGCANQSLERVAADERADGTSDLAEPGRAWTPT
jgi:hypothetical protein